MNHEIYIAVTNVLIAHLAAHADKAKVNGNDLSKHRHWRSYEKNVVDDYDFKFPLAPFTKYVRARRVNAELVGKVRNAISLFCRNGIELMTYDEKRQELRVRLFANCSSINDNRTVLKIDCREYTAASLGLLRFSPTEFTPAEIAQKAIVPPSGIKAHEKGSKAEEFYAKFSR